MVAHGGVGGPRGRGSLRAQHTPKIDRAPSDNQLAERFKPGAANSTSAGAGIYGDSNLVHPSQIDFLAPASGNTMDKQTLIQLHMALIKFKIALVESEITPEDFFYQYEKLGIYPTKVGLSKTDHRRAIFQLIACLDSWSSPIIEKYKEDKHGRM